MTDTLLERRRSDSAYAANGRALPNSKNKPFLMINPEAFSLPSANIGTQVSNQDHVTSEENADTKIIQGKSIYDAMSNTNPDQVSSKYLGTIDLKKYNPILGRSLDRNSQAAEGDRSIFNSSASSEVYSESDRVSRNVRNILSTSSLSLKNQELGNLIRELRAGQKSLEEELHNRSQRLEGARTNLKNYAQSFDSVGMKANAMTSEVVKIGYTGLHKLGNLIRNIPFLHRYEIFTAPPTSLIDQCNKQITETSKEIELHKNALTKGNIELKKIDGLIKLIEDKHGKFENESDPQLSISLVNDIKTASKEVVSILSSSSRNDDPELKKELDALRKSVQEGFSNLDRQFGFAESGLRATEKGLVVVGAIGGAAFTGGTSLGILAGVGVGGVGSMSQSAGHFLGNVASGNSENFSAKEELSKFGSDLKDAALYASGQRLSMALLGRTAQVATSAGRLKGVDPVSTLGKAVGNLNQASKPLNYLNPYTYSNTVAGVFEASVKTAELAGTAMRGAFGGLASGIIVESPAALFDTTRSVMTDKNMLDPSGRLREMGVSDLSLWTRALTIRLATAGSGGVFGFGAARIRNNLAPTGGILRDRFSSVGRFATNVAEVPLDLAANVNTEAYLSGWLYGKDGRLREEDIEQLLVSGIAGHAAGRFNQAGINRIEAQRQQQVEAHATRVNQAVDQALADVGLRNNSNVAAVAGTRFDVNIEVPRQANRNLPEVRHVGMHLGHLDRLADKRSSQLEHRVRGEAFSSTLSKADNKLRNGVNEAIKTINKHLIEANNSPGIQPVLQRDRHNAQISLKSSVRDRAYGLYSISLPEKRKNPALLRQNADLLHDHVERFINERRGSDNANQGVSWYSNLIDNIINPYGAKRPKVKFELVDNPDALGNARGLRGILANTTLLPAKKFINFIDNNIFPITDGLRSIRDAGIMSGLGLYTATTGSIYGSMGMIGGTIYSGILGASRGLSELGSAALALYKYTPHVNVPSLENLLFSRGSARDVGNLIGKVAEGRVLIDRLNELMAIDNTLVNQAQLQRLIDEVDLNRRLLVRANNRYGGMFGAIIRFGASLPERTLSRFSVDEKKDISKFKEMYGLKKSESSNRMLSFYSVAKALKTSQELFEKNIHADFTRISSNTLRKIRNSFNEDVEYYKMISLYNRTATNASVLNDINRLEARRLLVEGLQRRAVTANQQEAQIIADSLRYIEEGPFIDRINRMDRATLRKESEVLKDEMLRIADDYSEQPNALSLTLTGALIASSPLSNRHKNLVKDRIFNICDEHIEVLGERLKNEKNEDTKKDLEKEKKNYEKLKEGLSK